MGLIGPGGRYGGGRAGAMGTSGLCPKSCKRFGVKYVRRVNLWAKIGGVWAKIGVVWAKEEDLFERARTFHDFLEDGYKTDHPTIDWTLHSDYRQE